MNWAAGYIEQLKQGKIVQFRPKGNSMSGLIESGQLVTVHPLSSKALDPVVGDIVLCKVRGRCYLHLIKAIRGKQYQIGNARGGINGWISIDSIFGIAISVL